MQNFKDQVVIVTGATSGIGKRTAIEFAKAGAKVVLAGRRQAQGDAVIAQMGGADAVFVKTDVTVAADVERLVETTIGKFGRLDCAFNNAGIGGQISALADLSEDDWDSVMDINLKGVWLCLKYQIPAMLKTGGGNIVNMGSLWAVGASKIGLAPYIASKHGLIGLTRAAALEYADKGIRVNAICPGWIPTEANAHLLDNEQIKTEIIANTPVGRLGSQEDIAQSVMWLCSDKTGFVTGHTLMVDGGNSICTG